MDKVKNKKELQQALLWILGYIILVNIGDEIGRNTGLNNLVTTLLLLCFSGILLKKYRFKDLLLQLPERQVYAQVWFYIPLFLLAFIQWFVGLDTTLLLSDILGAALLMMSVGFIEEVLFRGLLFQAIEKKSTTKRAIIISGITFGFGHIVNLLRGILLALLVAKTRSIIPGALFHALFNFSGTVTKQDTQIQAMLLIPILIISVVYCIVINRMFSKQGLVTT
jgi:membrane protease YdiL (CAAX protease family)